MALTQFSSYGFNTITTKALILILRRLFFKVHCWSLILIVHIPYY